MEQKRNLKKFTVPGVFHRLVVYLSSRQFLTNYLERKRDDYYGSYDLDLKEIVIVKDLNFDVKRHTLYHEISHHIWDELKKIQDEETKCDVLGFYLMRLTDERDKINKHLR